MSIDNLQKWLSLSDTIDEREGLLAYERYRQTMIGYAIKYDTTLEIATAVFCALSPNNDYFGNLRSMASVLNGVKQGHELEDVTVSTYKHCRDRAWLYATGEVKYLAKVKGPKIKSFYLNIINPKDPDPITIDGHMKCCWTDLNMTMREAIVKSKKEYEVIANGCRDLAKSQGILPNQLQAILWFTRKRVCNVKYDGQTGFFGNPLDLWGTYVDPRDASHYEPTTGIEPEPKEELDQCQMRMSL